MVKKVNKFTNHILTNRREEGGGGRQRNKQNKKMSIFFRNETNLELEVSTQA